MERQDSKQAVRSSLDDKVARLSTIPRYFEKSPALITLFEIVSGVSFEDVARMKVEVDATATLGGSASLRMITERSIYQELFNIPEVRSCLEIAERNDCEQASGKRGGQEAIAADAKSRDSEAGKSAQDKGLSARKGSQMVMSRRIQNKGVPEFVVGNYLWDY